MALSPQALIKGLVSRVLPAANADSANTDVALRLDTYGGLFTYPLVRKAHGLADEGTYWVVNNSQTGITPPLAVGYVATTPALVIYNNDTLGRKLFLDYITLSNIVAVTATTSVVGEANAFYALVIDNSNRYSSGGTVLPSPVNVNMQSNQAVPNILSYFGAVTALAATTAARTLVGQRMTRPSPTTSALTLVGDTWLINFGGVEQATPSSITVTNAGSYPVPMPPAMVPWGSSLLLYLWWANHTPAGGAAGFLPEVGFWMR